MKPTFNIPKPRNKVDQLKRLSEAKASFKEFEFKSSNPQSIHKKEPIKLIFKKGLDNR